MIKTGLPTGLIRYATEDEIEKEEKETKIKEKGVSSRRDWSSKEKGKS